MDPATERLIELMLQEELLEQEEWRHQHMGGVAMHDTGFDQGDARSGPLTAEDFVFDIQPVRLQSAHARQSELARRLTTDSTRQSTPARQAARARRLPLNESAFPPQSFLQLQSSQSPRDTADITRHLTPARHAALARRFPTNVPVVPRRSAFQQQTTLAQRPLNAPSEHKARPTMWPVPRDFGPGGPNQQVSCIVCMDSFKAIDAIPLRCGHYYCKPCLDGHLHNTFTNEAAFPLKCCQAEVFSQVQQYLPRSLIAEYHAKAAEFADKVNRTYCHDADCAAWIPAKNFSGDWGRCNKCGEKTCKLCKGGDHGIDCPKDEALAKVLEEGDRKGWKRCKYCRAMLELKDGCNHMTCSCGYQFCWACEARYKTCACPAYEQRHPSQVSQGEREVAFARGGMAPFGDVNSPMRYPIDGAPAPTIFSGLGVRPSRDVQARIINEQWHGRNRDDLNRQDAPREHGGLSGNRLDHRVYGQGVPLSESMRDLIAAQAIGWGAEQNPRAASHLSRGLRPAMTDDDGLEELEQQTQGLDLGYNRPARNTAWRTGADEPPRPNNRDPAQVGRLRPWHTLYVDEVRARRRGPQ